MMIMHNVKPSTLKPFDLHQLAHSPVATAETPFDGRPWSRPLGVAAQHRLFTTKLQFHRREKGVGVTWSLVFICGTLATPAEFSFGEASSPNFKCSYIVTVAIGSRIFGCAVTLGAPWGKP